ncbi:MAG: hypothetical protein LBJ73_03975 [Rickettsiales bacterium]|jgi:hypothetical protein|nr:hypothetical protein [Rickettsiales bacterium]
MNDDNQMKVCITAVGENGVPVIGNTMSASDNALKMLSVLASNPNFGASLGFIRACEKNFTIKHKKDMQFSNQIVSVFGYLVEQANKVNGK